MGNRNWALSRLAAWRKKLQALQGCRDTCPVSTIYRYSFIFILNDETEMKFETINMFLGNVLLEMKKVSMKSSKQDMIAYISAWENELQTIKFIIQ